MIDAMLADARAIADRIGGTPGALPPSYREMTAPAENRACSKVAARREKVVELRNMGMQQGEIARELGLSTNTVKNDLYHTIWKPVPKDDAVEQRRDTVLQMMHDGFSLAEIQREMGEKLSTIKHDIWKLRKRASQ